jgi:thioredoxin-related protein
LLVVIVVLFAPQSFAAVNPWIKSLDVATKKAKDGKKMVFVDLFAQWCGWCHRFEQEVTPTEAFQNATDDMVLLRLNTEDGGEGTRFAQKYDVRSLPTFLILTPELNLAAVIRGYFPAPQFAKLVTEAKTKQVDFSNRVKNEAKIAKDYTKRLDLAREFAARQLYDQSEPRLRKLTSEQGVPKNVREQAYYDLAVTQYMSQKHADALKTIKALLASSNSGDSVERGRLLSAQIYADQGNLQLAVNELKSFKTAFPNSALLNNVNSLLPAIERQLATKQ